MNSPALSTPLNHTLELQRTEFDSDLVGRGLCFYAATLGVPLLSIYFFLYVELVLSGTVSYLRIKGVFICQSSCVKRSVLGEVRAYKH